MKKNKITLKVAKVYDFLHSNKYIYEVEKLFVYTAIAGLLVHLFLIYLSRNFEQLFPLLQTFSTNYLSAVYTPFSIIILFEVLLLIFSIPKSNARSIGRQYEIISLITIREAFKELGKIQDINDLSSQPEVMKSVLYYMIGALVMFMLIAFFYHIRKKRKEVDANPTCPRDLSSFIALKKTIALGLGAMLLGDALYEMIIGMIKISALPSYQLTNTSSPFYHDIFMIIVFVNVITLIISYIYTNDYELVFRNSGFVISSMLILFSLTASAPYDLIIALIGMTFGVLVSAVYNYFRCIHAYESR